MFFYCDLLHFSAKLSLYLIYFSFILYNSIICDQTNKPIQIVSNKFGVQMLNIGYEKSCFVSISESFQMHRSEIKQIDATKLMEEMRKDLVNMLNWKKDAVERIAIQSEKLFSQYAYDKEVDYTGHYNMKTLSDDHDNNNGSEVEENRNSKALPLSPHPNFEDSLVNLHHSAVHVPINVYEKAADILNDIKWSEDLTETFENNLSNDPSLSWQFFGSSKGFIRVYPATTWKVPNDTFVQSKTQPPDLYDCRVRQWYIQAAASPKDIVILLDISGSMTGLRRHIALSVVHNILDTLNEDDFVLVMKFNNEVKYMNSCIDQMVQASRRNIKDIKESLDSIKTYDIANFTAAFITGFDILKNFSRSDQGSQCNQAIMLITDGAPETYEPVFRQHNPDGTIRVFTYVIGREVTQINEVYWMACHNRGYYAQVANLAEVREQVQQYIPVMSRPLVLSESRIFTWTPVYAPITEIQLNDWIWNERVKAVKTRLLEKANQIVDQEEKKENEYVVVQESGNEDDDEWGNNMPTAIRKIELEMAKKSPRKNKPLLMTTISTPVLDPRKYINVTKKILHKNVYLDSEPEPIRIANLLGVAGTDVPIKEIEKMAPQYRLGVNGYSFMITNNGKFLFHPDFRPIFQDMLKPFYSSVDFSEVELGNMTDKPRLFDSDIEWIRSDLINGSRGSKKLTSKSFLDSMKRPSSRKQHYVYGKVDHTPFSFGIVLPEPYGSYRFGAQIDLKNKAKSENYTRYFSGTLWRIHPDWVYCDNPHKISGLMASTPEEALVQFLSSDLMKDNFQWRTSSENPPRYSNFTCDKDLLQSLVFDAMTTHTFSQCSEFSRKFKRRDDKTMDILNAFISTRSGLTRFTNSYFSYEYKNRTSSEYNNLARSIDEVFYRRAVDYYSIDSKAFVYSVPFDASKKDEFMVTSSHAIFVGNGKMSSPVAVVGLQYNYTSFYNIFKKIAESNNLNCGDGQPLDCFVLDNNAYIIISSVSMKQAGGFFGEVNGELLQDMVRTGVFRKVHYYDYQAICIDIISTSSSSMFLTTPLNYLRRISAWFLSRLFTFYLNIFYDSWLVSLEDSGDSDYEGETTKDSSYNKSRPKTCDKEFDLYELNRFNQTLHHVQTCDNDCAKDYYVQHIPHSNLIILTLTKNCYCPTSSIKLESKPIVYSPTEMCEFFKLADLRKRPDSCFNYHIKESEVKYCGGSARLECHFVLCIVLLSLLWTKNGRVA